MRSRRLLSIFCLLLVVPKYVYGADTILKNVVVYDGTAKKPFKADVRIKGDRIAAIAKTLVPQLGETVRDEHGLALAKLFKIKKLLGILNPLSRSLLYLE